MHTAPLAERIDFVRYKIAEIHFGYAGAAIDLSTRAAELHNPIFYQQIVWTAFFVNYAKPFKQMRDRDKGFGMRLPDDIVPDQYREAHDGILALRDKHFAHTDLNLRTSSLSKQPEELLLAVAVPDGITFGISSIIPSDETVECYKKLLGILMEKVSYRAGKIMRRWSKRLRVPENTIWTVSLSKNTDEILKRIFPENTN
jgi:hypothetical protein